MAKSIWNSANIPDQKGKIAIVTGSTSGLGKEAVRVLALKGAQVIMAVRNTEKGDKVAKQIKENDKGASIQVMELDLGSLKSVKAFSTAFLKKFDRLDILINNAGVMMCPFSKTEDGFEIQMGTNHLGHFALTGHLMPLLKKTPGSRVVATSSIAHRNGNIDFSDINWESRSYKTGKAYGDSKIANLYFAYELSKKLSSEGNNPLVTAAHPGWTATELQRHSGMFKVLNKFFAQDLSMGTLPTLRAATDPEAKAGDFFGPSGMMELRGSPKKVESNALSQDKKKAEKLWEISELLTDVKF